MVRPSWVEIDLDDVALGELTLEHLEGQRVLHFLLYRPPQGPCPKGRIKTLLGEILAVADLHPDEYHEITDISVPYVYATHPVLEYLGGTPYFWAAGPCPLYSGFDAVIPAAGLVGR